MSSHLNQLYIVEIDRERNQSFYTDKKPSSRNVKKILLYDVFRNCRRNF